MVIGALQGRIWRISLLTTLVHCIYSTTNSIENEFILHGIPQVITETDNNDLMRVLDDAEILRILKNMKSWKAPGPDSFSPGFYKSHWDIVGYDVVQMVKRFFQTSFLLKSLNSTNISLT